MHGLLGQEKSEPKYFYCFLLTRDKPYSSMMNCSLNLKLYGLDSFTNSRIKQLNKMVPFFRHYTKR